MDRMTRQLEGILKNGDVFHQSEEVGKLNLKNVSPYVTMNLELSF